MEREQAILSSLQDDYRKLVEAKLNLNLVPREKSGETRPVGRPKWGQVRTQFEDSKRKEVAKAQGEGRKAAHWHKKIEEVEAADAAKAENK